MKTNVRSLRLFIGMLLAFLCLSTSSVFAEPNNDFPNQADVSPTANVLSTAVGKTNYIQIKNTYLQIYSTTPVVAVAVTGADLCQNEMINATRDEIYNAGGIAFGDPVTTYDLTGYGAQQSSESKAGDKRNAGTCAASASNSKQYPSVGDNANSPSGLPASTVMLKAQSSKKILTQQGELYVFTFRAHWDADGGCGGPHCALNTFRVSAFKVSGNTIQSGSSSEIYVSQAGREEAINGVNDVDDSSAFGVGITRAPSVDFSDYNAYFGTPCTVTSNKSVYVEIYDDDNLDTPGAQDTTKPFRVRIEEKAPTPPIPPVPPNPQTYSAWTTTNLTSIDFLTSGGPIRNNNVNIGGNTWKEIGTSGSKNRIKLNFMAKPGYKYRFMVQRLDKRNNLQFQLPYSGLWSARSCASWQLDPETEISVETQEVGKPVTWKHWIDNVGGANSPAGQSWSVYQTGASSGNGMKASGSTPSITSGGTYNIAGAFSYTPTNADVGRTICQELRVNPFRQTGGSKTSTPPPPQCVLITPPKPPITDRVKITPNASPNFGGQVEADDPIGFSGYVSVSNFPTIPDYGYDNQSQKLAPRRVQPVKAAGPHDTTTATVSAISGPHYYCSNGATIASGCYSPPYQQCSYSYYPTFQGCPPNGYYTVPGSYGYVQYYYVCPSTYSSNNNGTCSRTEYRCTETGGAYTYPAPSCRTYYTCEGGVPGQGWHYASSPPQCNRWYCAYSDSPAYDQASAPTNCEYRCNGGTAPVSANPGRALLTTDHVNGTGDRNCYVKPSFNMRCQWTTPSGAVISQSDVVVTANGSWCSSSQTQPPGQIGQTICLSYRALDRPTNWNETPSPTRRNGNYVKYWDFQFDPPATACMKVVGRPYVRVVGGDVSAGVGASMNPASCPASSSALVTAQNKGASNGYSGAGASIAVLARGAINGFASGQFANPILGTAPKALTFANTSGTWGGNFGAAAACVDVSKFVASSTVFPYGGGGTVNPGNQRYKITNANVVISGNVVYAGSNGTWTSIENIPLMQLLVVGGNIYIGSNVSQLDGTYIATSQGGVGGNIYTCASGTSPITSTWSNVCNQRQLVVNGSLIADKVHLGRDCSTLNRSSSFELTLYSGGSDPQQCDPLGRTKAAEVINFLPDQWIRSSVGVPTTRYDAVTSMSPIL